MCPVVQNDFFLLSRSVSLTLVEERKKGPLVRSIKVDSFMCLQFFLGS